MRDGAYPRYHPASCFIQALGLLNAQQRHSLLNNHIIFLIEHSGMQLRWEIQEIFEPVEAFSR